MVGRRSRESQSAGKERDERRKGERERERREWTRESEMRERFLFQSPFLPKALLHLLPGLGVKPI